MDDLPRRAPQLSTSSAIVARKNKDRELLMDENSASALAEVRHEPHDAARETVAAELRYRSEMEGLISCPPAPSTSPRTVGYRFATSDLADANNALPVIKINPSRFVGEHKPCCSALALSMYLSLPALINRARKGVKSNPNFLKRLGNHYVEVNISSLGRQCEPNNEGHFDFFEYTSFNFRQQVLSHGRIEL